MPAKLGSLLFAAMLSGTAMADQAGRALAQKVYDRPDGNDAVTTGSMTLLEKGGSPRTRTMHSYALEKGGAQTWSLVRFSAPDDIAGTGLLTKDNPDADTDQWVFLPALGTTRRIPGDRKGGNFVGSDLFYEDLQDRKVDMDEHRLLGKDSFQGAPCDLLESIPTQADNSVYTKRVSCIHEQTLIPVRIDFYQGKPEPVKRLEVVKIAKQQGFWTVMESRMTNLETGHQTRVTVDKIRYDQGLPDSLFSQATLEDPARDAEWRK